MSMMEIPLPSGDVALIDDCDWPLVSGHHWLLFRNDKHRYVWANIRVDGKRKRILMHRLLVDAKAGEIVDHINGNGLDNRRSANLRKASASANASNRKKRDGVSRYKGVYSFKGKWRAQISSKTFEKSPWYIGTFDTERDAALAYDAIARVLFGEASRVNFPRPSDRCAISAATPPPGGRRRAQEAKVRETRRALKKVVSTVEALWSRKSAANS